MTGMNFTLPRTCVVDDTLDVQQRLRDLAYWQEEFRPYYKMLLQKMTTLSPSQTFDFQRVEYLLMLQQRQSIGWLKQPLEHTPETVTSPTYDALYEHLGGQFARLSVDERMQWLDNLNYIVTPHGRKLIYTLQQFIGANIAREHRKLLILGGAGTGKTDNVHRFMTHCNNLPVIAVMSPSYKAGRTTRTLVSYLLEACHVDVKPRTRYTTMTRQLREAVEQQAHLSLVPERFTILQYPPPPTAAPANVRVRS